MLLFIKKKFFVLISIFFILGCSTAVTVVDTTTSVTVKAVTGTVKGIVHVTTCPFTDKDCF